ncbi:GNAT family N-acetyltransferase [Clostridium perfringens]
MKNNEVDLDNLVLRDLQWDTEYFGVKCGRIDLIKNINEKDSEYISKFLNSKDFVILTNSKKLPHNSEYIGKNLKTFITDINVQLKKKQIKVYDDFDDSNIEISNNINFENEIVELAKNAFENSRFLNDSNITKEKAEGVYANWVSNSFKKESKYFITYKLEEKIIGFILFSINELNELVIELICVSNKFKGKGIGTVLMKKLDMFALENKSKLIKVGTQIENINALNFYTSCGYKIDDIKYIYHWWNKC